MSIQSSNEIVLECREADSFKDTDAESFGVYTTTLTNPITITEGTVVEVRNAFCDTASTSDGKIVVPEDTDLVIAFGLYFVNFDETFTDNGAGGWLPNKRDYEQDDQTGAVQDGKMYIRSVSNAINPLNRRQLNRLRFFKGDIPRLQKTGAVSGTFWFINEQNQEQDIPFSVPSFPTIDFKEISLEASKCMVLFDDRSKYGIKYDSKKWKKADVDGAKTQYQFDPTPPSADPIFSPHTDYAGLTIKQNLEGYDPEELGLIISRALSNYQTSDDTITSNDPSANYFLTTSADFVGADLTTSYYVSSDGANICNFKAGINSWIGASQIDFHYDTTARKFVIGALHTPYYFGTALGNEIMTNEAGNSFLVNKAGGAFIMGMNSKPSSQPLFDANNGNVFWFNQLGINPNVVAPYKRETKSYTNILNASIPIFDFIEGTNITANFTGVDYNIKKPSSATLPDRLTLMTVPALSDINGTTNSMVEIFGEKMFSQGIAESGYFLIEADLGLYSDFIGQQKTSNKIKGILNRYYSANSYTSGGAETAIPYVHKGLPLQIKTIKIRILDPSQRPASESEEGIGADNTVFITVRQPPS
tara:strand:- start:682 stop:2448 length:1767 start_codon:yes stop_codon:yes gene_type:complete